MTGLAWQLILVSDIYFGYKVRTTMDVKFPDDLSPQATSFCSRYTDILDFDRLNYETGRNWSYTQDQEKIWMYQSEMKVGEIFKYTPPVETVMNKIVYRRPGTFERFDRNGSDVWKTFAATKFLYLDNVCYRMFDRKGKKMSYRSLSVTPSSPGVIYEIYLNDSMTRTNFIQLSLHGQVNMPFRSLKFSPVLRRQYHDADKSFKYNMYASDQLRLTTKLLEPPYVTNCFNYRSIGINSDAECVQICLKNRTIERYNMLPFSIIINGSSAFTNYTVVSFVNVANADFGQQITKIEDECERSVCKRRDCEVRTAVTFTNEFSDSDVPVIGLRWYVPTEPWVTITSSPALLLVEFLTYVMSCVNTWTGVTIMSFEPVKLLRKILMSKALTKSKESEGRIDWEEKLNGLLVRKARRHTASNMLQMHIFSMLSERVMRLEKSYNNLLGSSYKSGL